MLRKRGSSRFTFGCVAIAIAVAICGGTVLLWARFANASAIEKIDGRWESHYPVPQGNFQVLGLPQPRQAPGSGAPFSCTETLDLQATGDFVQTITVSEDPGFSLVVNGHWVVQRASDGEVFVELRNAVFLAPDADLRLIGTPSGVESIRVRRSTNNPYLENFVFTGEHSYQYPADGVVELYLRTRLNDGVSVLAHGIVAEGLTAEFLRER